MSRRSFGDSRKFWLALSAIMLMAVLLLWPQPMGRMALPVLPALAPPAVPRPVRPRPETALRAAPAPHPRLFITTAEDAITEEPVPAAPLPVPTPAGGGVLRKIAFASNREDGRYFHIYMMDADGKNLEQLTGTRAFDRDPHFSFDGKYLVFASNRELSCYQIFMLDLESRQLRQITTDRRDKTNPFWSPDNRQILYTVHDHGVNRLGIMNADGSEQRELTTARVNNHGYGFSPDGRSVSFTDQDNHLLIMDLQSLTPSRLIKTEALDFRGNPGFSPQGKRLVFTSDVLAHKLRQLYIYDLDWQRNYPITRDEFDKDYPIFSPDGTKIAYTACVENAWNIFIMDADGRNPRNLTQSRYDHIVPTWR
jgi:TolB protein